MPLQCKSDIRHQILQKTWWQVDDTRCDVKMSHSSLLLLKGALCSIPCPEEDGLLDVAVSSLCRRHPCFRLTSHTFRWESCISHIGIVTLFCLAGWHSKKRNAGLLLTWTRNWGKSGGENLDITPFLFCIIYTKWCGTIKTSTESLRIRLWNLQQKAYFQSVLKWVASMTDWLS